MPGVRGEYARRLSEWTGPSVDPFVRYEKALESWCAPAPQARPEWSPEATKKAAEEIATEDFKVIPTPSFTRRAGTLPAMAYIESISGRRATCLVQVAGAELPVEIPVRLLDARGLKVGMRFLWWMSEDGSVTDDDIDDLPPNRLKAAEQDELRQLYEEFRADVASGVDWGLDPDLGR